MGVSRRILVTNDGIKRIASQIQAGDSFNNWLVYDDPRLEQVGSQGQRALTVPVECYCGRQRVMRVTMLDKPPGRCLSCAQKERRERERVAADLKRQEKGVRRRDVDVQIEKEQRHERNEKAHQEMLLREFEKRKEERAQTYARERELRV